ncbi:MAG: DUF6273 domain-containing protein [Firmicutes bacterium]|nr:DUF6273 domain-containing protein [Bacillota bacterium]
MKKNEKIVIDYESETKGMRKEERISYLSSLFKESTSELYLSFGSYYQSKKNKSNEFIKEPIIWKILNFNTFQTDNYIFLLSKYLLDSHHFSFESNEYKTSDVRKFVNDHFYNNAFNKGEKKRINLTNIDDYSDYVFLLSKEDYETPQYFINDDSRKASCTDFALYNRGYQSSVAKAGVYWTRSKGKKNLRSVTIIEQYGRITSWTSYHVCPGWHGGFCSMPYETIRPAIRIKI